MQELGIGSDNYQIACDNICKGEPDNLRKYFANNKKKSNEELEAERQRLLSEMPRGFEIGPILARHLKEIHRHYKETGRIKNSPEETQRRVDICMKCPSKRSVMDNNGSLRCADCSCHIDKGILILGGKAEYEAINCQRGHWKT